MRKLVSQKEVVNLSKKFRERGKSVGLIVGSFDILHMGHVNLFRFAKKRVDFLVVGLDNDKTIKKTKGKGRPVNNYKRRSEFLSELSSVDCIFKIDETYVHGDKTSFKLLIRLLKSINPSHLFTSIKCDSLWKEKRKLAIGLKIRFVAEKTEVTHSTNIIKILESDL